MLVRSVGSFEPSGRVQPAIVSQCSGLEAVPGTVVTELACASVSSVLCASVSSESRRMAFGIWPCGLWTLAAWRGLFCASSRLGVRGYQGRMVSNLPSPCPSTCYRCPDGALWWLASARTKRPTMGFSLIGAFPAYEPRRQGGRECAVR